MSGIVGIYRLDQSSVNSDDLWQMVDSLAHRGPDGADTWHEGLVGLGHCMLWTTPESLLEKLPLVNYQGDLIITADARIDNRDELASILDLPNRPLDKITDSDFILAAYQKWGEECPKKLLGDFSFAIWDRQKQQLFCARDHLGIKPFYYFRSATTFIFASEIKALLALAEVPRQLDERKILDYLNLNLKDKSSSVYQNIWRLPPAHTLVLSLEKTAQPIQYWELDLERELDLASDRAYEKAFRNIFTEAVRCRLRSAFPVGSHLSGGLDSSSIVCTARNLLKKDGRSPLHTFSNIFPKVSGSDEQKFIHIVENQGDLCAHHIEADRVGPLSDHSDFFQHVDEPLIGNGYLFWGLNQAAHQDNVRIVLNGYDGDTTVSHGILRLQELANKKDWRTLVSEVQKLTQNLDSSDFVNIRLHTFQALRHLARQKYWISFWRASWALRSTLRISFRRLVLKYAVKVVLPRRIRDLIRQFYYKPALISNKKTFIQPGFTEKVSKATYTKKPRSSHRVPKTVREQQWQDFTYGVTVAIEVVDLLSAPFDIEPRYPFMDKRLIEFCLALPAEQKLKAGWTRSILRRAMQDILPEQVQWRNTKTTPEAAFRDGLKTYDKKLIDKILEDKSELLERYVNLDTLRVSYWSFLEGETDVNTSIGIGEVWAAFSLSLWLRANSLEGGSQVPSSTSAFL